MNLFVLALILATIGLGCWAYQEHQKEKNQRGFNIIGGIILAVRLTGGEAGAAAQALVILILAGVAGPAGRH